MPCTQTLAGIAKDCQANMGGIKKVLIGNHADVSGITVTDGKISAITMSESAKFADYAFAKNTCSLTSTYTVDPASGVRFVTSELLMQFNRMETTKRVEINALAQGELIVIVVDANDVAWLLGKDEPVAMSAGDGQTGTARSDANRYTTTLQDISKELPYEVDASVLDTLL